MLFSVLTRKGSLKAQLSPCNVPVLVKGKQISASSSFSVTLYRRQKSRLSPRKEMQKRKMAVWGGLTNSCEKKSSEKQRRKGKI